MRQQIPQSRASQENVVTPYYSRGCGFFPATRRLIQTEIVREGSSHSPTAGARLPCRIPTLRRATSEDTRIGTVQPSGLKTMILETRGFMDTVGPAST